MSSTNRNSFIFSLPTSISLFSFSHLVALARTSSTTLKRNNDIRYFYLVPDFMGNIFSLLSLWYKLQAFHGCPLSGWGNSLLFCWVFFIMKGCWILSNVVLSVEMIFYFINIIYYIDWLPYVEPVLTFMG